MIHTCIFYHVYLLIVAPLRMLHVPAAHLHMLCGPPQQCAIPSFGIVRVNVGQVNRATAKSVLRARIEKDSNLLSGIWSGVSLFLPIAV